MDLLPPANRGTCESFVSPEVTYARECMSLAHSPSSIDSDQIGPSSTQSWEVRMIVSPIKSPRRSNSIKVHVTVPHRDLYDTGIANSVADVYRL
jgi:hypothetical protein